EEIPEGQLVAVMAEGKEHALATGITKMSTSDIKTINKGNGVELVQYLGDPLWKTHI
ncbi:translation machinery-associated protein 20, partial [Coemansia sp. RSA 1933]